MNLLEIRNFSVAYGSVEAVHSVDLTVGKGEIVTVIGPNGAGKTTLLSAIMGLQPSSGELSLGGERVKRVSVEAMVERGVALVPEKREVFAIFPRLKERRAQFAATLSGGERQMLAIGRALMARPQLLMLDEPSLGLAPLIVREVLQVVSSLRQHGVSVLLVEQNARAALRTADRAYVLEMGAFALSGPATELIHDRRIMETYLGLGGGQAT
jgi:branched-chain amino acid transport system ATP-binding protein